MANKENKKPEKTTPTSPFGKWGWVYLLIIGLLLTQWFSMGGLSNMPGETNWTEFKREMLAPGDVDHIVVVNKEKAEIYIKPEKLGQGFYEKIPKGHPGPQYFFNIGSVESFENKLEKAREELNLDPIPVSYEERIDWVANVLSWVLPFAIIIGIWMLILRRASGGMRGGMNPFDFGKSKAQLFDSDQRSNVTFEDVAGLDEAKLEVKEIVDFLKNPQRYTRLGAKIPKGVILVGPPGTGKTLLAKAVAGEAKVPFFSISGSEFVEMFVGVGASRVRDLFKKAKDKAPSIIFIDEIDAIGRSRSKAFSMQPNDERESTLNQLLTEMDGFENNTGVIVIAATNRMDILDRALLRPGRFDRHIYLDLPTFTERKAIFQVHMRKLKLADDIDLETLAAHTPGFTGADIANICNEAALIAARKNKEKIEIQDFYDAIDRVVAGLEKKNKIISEKEKNIVAHHEAGHATVSRYLKHADRLLKVSIVPRGRSLGAAWYLPEEHNIYTESQFMDRLCTALGGRAAEELVFGEISSGALDDLEKVTKQAYTMIAYYGFDKELGNLSYYDSTGEYSQSLQKPYSEATAQLIDQKVRALVQSAYERAKQVLTEHMDQMLELAKLLLEKEVVDRKDLDRIFGKDQYPSEREAKNEQTTPIHENE